MDHRLTTEFERFSWPARAWSGVWETVVELGGNRNPPTAEEWGHSRRCIASPGKRGT